MSCCFIHFLSCIANQKFNRGYSFLWLTRKYACRSFLLDSFELKNFMINNQHPIQSQVLLLEISLMLYEINDAKQNSQASSSYSAACGRTATSSKFSCQHIIQAKPLHLHCLCQCSLTVSNTGYPSTTGHTCLSTLLQLL